MGKYGSVGLLMYQQSRMSTKGINSSNVHWANQIMDVRKARGGQVPIVVMGGNAHSEPLRKTLKDLGQSMKFMYSDLDQGLAPTVADKEEEEALKVTIFSPQDRVEVISE